MLGEASPLTHVAETLSDIHHKWTPVVFVSLSMIRKQKQRVISRIKIVIQTLR